MAQNEESRAQRTEPKAVENPSQGGTLGPEQETGNGDIWGGKK